ncbi:Transcription factor tau 95 kDa subunit, putative [Perkinsus marinus ATCC 50983]|uniref:Transcription factor tau 95 kDa subunit, putative n=1 Tax=Perkinsus marinus (strain ATCC 50983 / TXsc) TaxID=423536 RepID=C5KLH4_PERM5|nr:Transcription factor tau 95 kDa subunit, putative [Perkinsus marinus ATCC 50983]EER14669.1 Transcription factor tau 95 kDa subunit, putative [Perkinsus marinus ATCC 50983]|eukprot:XP_002782873.1 Transcription factor tau 95 kDa subunit, putative [Perkinsus marinus ATCC 50983]
MSSESDGGGGNMIESMPHFMSILYPGSLEKADIEKVIDRNLEGLRKTADGRLKLRLHPKMPSTIKSSAYETSNFLFKARKHKSGKVTYKLVGLITEAHAFADMCDFMFTPPEEIRDTFIYTAAISQICRPQPYNFEGNAYAKKRKETSSAVEEEEEHDNGHHPNPKVPVHRFGDTTPVPTESGWAAGSGEDPVPLELLNDVQKKFEERPIWLRASLDEQLGLLGWTPQRLSGYPWKLSFALRAVSYLYLNGPWRNCYVRFGYDPKLNPEAVKFQVIDFRDPHFRSPAAAREHPSATTTATTITSESKPDVHFRRPPGNRSQIYQLCDIEDSAIQGVVENEVKINRLGKTLDPTSGWMAKSTMSSIRTQLKVRFVGR